MQGLGDRLRSLRKEAQLTQSELGRLLGLSKQTISCYENATRQPDAATLKRLASVFGVSVDYLLGNSQHRNPHKTGHLPDGLEGYEELSEEGKEHVREFLEFIKQKYPSKD